MDLLNIINNFLWDYIVVIVMIGAAVWFCYKTKLAHVTMVGDMFRSIKISSNTTSKKEVSSFQAFAISLASRVGVGNIAGVALAITIGGAGSIFWMWVIAVIVASAAFVESVLAQLYKSKSGDVYIGGPAYYVFKGLKRWTPAIIMVILNIFTFSFATCSIQSNTIALSNIEAFGISKYATAAIIAVIMVLLTFGGIKSIARFSVIVVPIMAIAYLVIAIIVIAINYAIIPTLIEQIFAEAFGFKEVAGATVGTAFMMGTKRGLFSNEAGMSSIPNAAATADVPHPINQGFMQAMGVFVDTILLCSCTAFIVLISQYYNPIDATGIALTQYALSSQVGSWAYQFIAIMVAFFGFSTCVSNSYYGEANIRFITQNRAYVNAFKVLMIIVVVIGALVPLDTMWLVMDFVMALMILFNLSVLVLLGDKVFLLLKDYKKQRREGIKYPKFKKSNIPQLNDSSVECWD